MTGCTALQTGQGFLSGLLGNIDCQAQTFGAFGYEALSDPASGAFALLSALLTIFIAVLGIRLLMGADIGSGDLAGTALKVGIVLTLATSWPAWRILGHDLVVHAPEELAAGIIDASGAPGASDLVQRLQILDDGIVVMTAAGSGRLTGGISAGADLGDSSRGIAIPDQSGLGWGRLFFLVGTIAPLALMRILGGILVGLAPLMAGLLLFAGARGLFMGWLRGLALCALGTLVLSLILSAQIAVMEPWLAGVLAQRGANVFTPSAPTELIAMTMVFALIAFGAIAILARTAFFSESVLSLSRPRVVAQRQDLRGSSAAEPIIITSSHETLSRAERTSLAIRDTAEREQRAGTGGHRALTPADRGEPGAAMRAPALGESWRRAARRTSAAGAARDARI